MSQLTYPLVPAVAYAGMLDSLFPKFAESRASEETVLEIPFGVVVSQGASSETCELPDQAADKLVGIVIHSHVYAPVFELGLVGLKPKQMASVLRRGRIWVVTETAVVEGDRLFVRYAAGAGGTQLGGVRNAAVASETIDATSQGVFRSAAGIGGLAILEVDFTNKP